MDNTTFGSLLDKVKSPDSRSQAAMLEGFYESSVASGSCAALFDEVNRISKVETAAVMLDMQAYNAARREVNKNIPEVKLTVNISGATEFYFPGCGKK